MFVMVIRVAEFVKIVSLGFVDNGIVIFEFMNFKYYSKAVSNSCLEELRNRLIQILPSFLKIYQIYFGYLVT
jgi:hypothetical protein